MSSKRPELSTVVDLDAPAASRTSSTKESTIETAQGTLHVQPFRNKGSKSLKAVLTFIPRASTFDRENVASGTDPFRGFFTLFWLGVFLLTVRTFVTSFETSGYPLSMNFATLLSKDAKTLLLSDAVLVSSTAIVVPFMKLVQKGYIKYVWTGIVIQHIFQTLFLGLAVAWTFNREWPWVQSGFFTLHSLTMLMKIHSYCSVNGHLSSRHTLAVETLAALKTECERPDIGGWEVALKAAQAEKDDENTVEILPSTEVSSSAATPGLEASTTLADPRAVPPAFPVGLRQRLQRLDTETKPVLPPISTAQNGVASSSASLPPRSPLPPDFTLFEHLLSYHPDPTISSLAHTLTSLEMELSSNPKHISPFKRSGSDGTSNIVRWPANMTLWNFMDYQLIPSLVYEISYPRTQRIRPLYLLEKTVATFGTFTLLYTYTEHYIIPITPTPDQPFLRSVLDLILPFMLCYLLLFYIIFECICNGFAELSFFADRQFYEDWWNATTWDEYARKWNKPVHTFLLRHVYASTISTFQLSKVSAGFVTFLLSALAHELVMAVVTKKIRLYLFSLQMIQIPMIALGKMPPIKNNKTIGNIVFWCGLFVGFPLLCVAYCAY